MLLIASEVRKIFPRYKDKPNRKEREILERIDWKIQEQAEKGEHIHEYYYAEEDGRFDIICNSLRQRGFSLEYKDEYITIRKVKISW